MTTGWRKITSYCSQISCILVEFSASIDNCKHVAKTQAMLVRVSINLEMPRERLSHAQKELEEINLCKKLACAKA